MQRTWGWLQAHRHRGCGTAAQTPSGCLLGSQPCASLASWLLQESPGLHSRARMQSAVHVSCGKRSAAFVLVSQFSAQKVGLSTLGAKEMRSYLFEAFGCYFVILLGSGMILHAGKPPGPYKFFEGQDLLQGSPVGYALFGLPPGSRNQLLATQSCKFPTILPGCSSKWAGLPGTHSGITASKA